MGVYVDKAGTGPAVIFIDTLYPTSDHVFKSRQYLLDTSVGGYFLQTGKNEKLPIKKVATTGEADSILNHAYFLKSYFALSHSLNSCFPLYHYTFRNGYVAWNSVPGKNQDHYAFISRTDKAVKNIEDSTAREQTRFSNTTNFILRNAETIPYTILIDSLKTLPAEYPSSSRYFSEVVYQVALVQPHYFFNILQDFYAKKELMFAAVAYDKKLVRLLRQTPGTSTMKKAFFKEYRQDKLATYKVIGLYTAITIGLILLL
ncbi:hypothetical protein LL912_16120 [Niabella sp. CC-SYL272]|uniref:hypothetical protein n=1 Tax=Niabella agricola TaxID=2891571 RepID=UPI001F1877BD|nr:hypothetical protein [Niabella agricola]MCF3110311.1 hypothetical protein [Niabella agricola]